MRKILSLFVALTAVLSLSAKTVYLVANSDWLSYDAVFFVHSWGAGDADAKLTAVLGETNVFSAEIPSGNNNLVFVRAKGGSESIPWDTEDLWTKTEDLEIPAGKDCFTLNGWTTGTWSVYGAKFYISGDSALVVDAGLDKAKTWAPDAIVSMADSKVLSLKANQTYKLLVTVDGTWNTKRQFDNLTDTVGGLFLDSELHICFRLASDGNVTVNYTSTTFSLSGSFIAPTVAVVGNFKGDDSWWVPVEGNTMEDIDGKSASVTFSLSEADNYEMKVWMDGTFYTKYGSGDLYIISKTWTNIPSVDVNTSGNNMRLTETKAGSYTFTWTYATRNLVVTYPTTPTAIDNTDVNAMAIKRIVNGQLVIEKNGVRYNALGIEVK